MCYIDILFYVKNKVHSISNDDNHDINDANIAKKNIHFLWQHLIYSIKLKSNVGLIYINVCCTKVATVAKLQLGLGACQGIAKGGGGGGGGARLQKLRCHIVSLQSGQSD